MVVIITKNDSSTTSIADIENGPMTNVGITGTTIIKGVVMNITAIGDLGKNGTDTQKNTQAYTNMEDISAKIHI